MNALCLLAALAGPARAEPGLYNSFPTALVDASRQVGAPTPQQMKVDAAIRAGGDSLTDAFGLVASPDEGLRSYASRRLAALKPPVLLPALESASARHADNPAVQRWIASQLMKQLAAPKQGMNAIQAGEILSAAAGHLAERDRTSRREDLLERVLPARGFRKMFNVEQDGGQLKAPELEAMLTDVEKSLRAAGADASPSARAAARGLLNSVARGLVGEADGSGMPGMREGLIKDGVLVPAENPMPPGTKGFIMFQNNPVFNPPDSFSPAQVRSLRGAFDRYDPVIPNPDQVELLSRARRVTGALSSLSDLLEPEIPGAN